MTTPDDLRIAAKLQNDEINRADAYLSAVQLPTYTEAIEALAALANAEGDAIAIARIAARQIVGRASGLAGNPPSGLWIQHFGRIKRPRSVKDIVLDISPICEMEDVGPMHSRIKVPADKLEAVREAVERVRINGHFIEYLPLETDK